MFGLIAKYRGRRAYKKHGYNQDLNPYTPRFNSFFFWFADNWTYWYEAHREEHYKAVIPDYDVRKNYPTTWDFN